MCGLTPACEPYPRSSAMIRMRFGFLAGRAVGGVAAGLTVTMHTVVPRAIKSEGMDGSFMRFDGLERTVNRMAGAITFYHLIDKALHQFC